MAGFLDSLGGFAGQLEDIFDSAGSIASNLGKIGGVGSRPVVSLGGGLGLSSGFYGVQAPPAPPAQPVTQTGGFSMNSTLLLILAALAVVYFLFIK